MLTIVEKVIFLQKVDVFSEVPTEQLAYLAAIATELSHPPGAVIYREQDPSDAMYLVLEGRVRQMRGEVEVTSSGPEDAFGTWALFDDEARLSLAVTAEATHLLRIQKEDFIDLLADNVQITQGVLKAIVKRLRGLLGRLAAAPPSP